MSIHTFTIEFSDGARRTRCEWGKTRLDALRTIWSIYGKENVKVVAG